MSLLVCCFALAAAAGTASATAPTLSGTFTCSVATPCGALTSITPGKVAVDEATGDVYLIDSANDVVDKFDSAGNYVSQILGSSTTSTTFGFGGEDDIAVDNSGGSTQGNVYVVSENRSFGGSNGAVFAFNASGTELWERPGIDGGASDTCGIGVDANGHPWAADYDGQTVAELSVADGSLTGTSVGTAGQTINPCEIAFDANNNLYVANWHTSLSKYDSTGSFVSTISSAPTFDAATDSQTGDVYAVIGSGPGAGNEVDEWDSSGSVVSGTPFDTGSTNVTGVAVNGSARLAYVSDVGNGNVQIFDLPPVPHPPVNATGSASSITQTGATLGGTVNPNGVNVTDCHFDYGTTTSYGSQAACASLPGSGTSAVPVSADISGLSANTTYHFRVVATNADGTTAGSDATFRTLPDAPTVTTGSASSVRQTSATAGGTVNPNGGNVTDCHVDYGTTASYGSQVACASLPGSGTSAVAVSGALSGLSANTTYHFRVVATNAGGTTNGSDATFRTLANAPAVVTGAASGIGDTAATIAGTVNPNGDAASCHFDYGTTTAYGSVAPCASSPGAGSSAVGVSAALSGLASGTTYHYRLVASNGGGSTNGADQTFTTTRTVAPPTCATDASLCHVRLVLASHTASIKGSRATVKVSCTGDAGGTCRGSVTFKATIKVKVKKGHKTVVKKKTITIGSASYDLAAGSSGSLSIKLSSAAKSALKKGNLIGKATGLDGSVKFPKTKAKHKKHK